MIVRECDCDHAPSEHRRVEHLQVHGEGGWWLKAVLCTHEDTEKCPTCGHETESECGCNYIDDESVFVPHGEQGGQR